MTPTTFRITDFAPEQLIARGSLSGVVTNYTRLEDGRYFISYTVNGLPRSMHVDEFGRRDGKQDIIPNRDAFCQEFKLYLSVFADKPKKGLKVVKAKAGNDDVSINLLDLAFVQPLINAYRVYDPEVSHNEYHFLIRSEDLINLGGDLYRNWGAIEEAIKQTQTV